VKNIQNINNIKEVDNMSHHLSYVECSGNKWALMHEFSGCIYEFTTENEALAALNAEMEWESSDFDLDYFMSDK